MRLVGSTENRTFDILGRRNPLKSRSKPTEAKTNVEEPTKESSQTSSENTSAQLKPKSKLFWSQLFGILCM